jgi:TPR repeat protein
LTTVSALVRGNFELQSSFHLAHLRPGKQAALLSHDKTLDLYRANAKKTNDPELIFEFAVFMIDAAKSMEHSTPSPSPGDSTDHVQPVGGHALSDKRDELIKEATALLKKLADRGHPDAQYFLADCYANGIGTVRNRQDFDRAFPLFVLSAKHGHPDACYRAGTCCEHGWGCRRESAKAVQFYR